MPEMWLDITDIPATGREFSFSDPAIWAEPIAEFGLAHRVTDTGTPIHADLAVYPQGRGVLLRGSLGGVIATPCDRCAEEARVTVDSTFELFEELPLEDEQTLEPGLLRRRGKLVELDVAGLLWEQFLLALPVKPLCDENCPGLCPRCGASLREGPCGCDREEGDPRLAVFKTLKAPRGSN